MTTRHLLGALVLAALTSCGSGDDEENEVDEAAEATAAQAPTTPGQPVQITEETAGLFAKAAITPDQARRTALASVPGSEMIKGELEEEDGTLIYSFDLRVAGRDGITEVHVDARTGAVVKTEHEGEAEEGTGKAKTG